MRVKGLFNKIAQSVLIAAVTLLFLGGLATTGHAADDSLKTVEDKGTLVVATSPDYPPYEFQATVHGKSKVIGMDMDVMKKVAKDLGVKLEIKSMNFDSLLVAIQTGKADVAVGGINPTAERRQSVDFSDIYYLVVKAF